MGKSEELKAQSKTASTEGSQTKEDVKMEEEDGADNSDSDQSEDPEAGDAPQSQNTKEETKKSACVNKANVMVKRKRDEKKVMLDDDEAKKAIAEFMEAQNRPFSVQNLIDNLSGRIKKTQTQRICDELCEDKILIVKEYNKTKVYMINQDIFPDTSTEDLDLLDEQIRIRRVECDELQNQLKELAIEVKRITTEPTNKELDDEIAKLEKEDKLLTKKLKNFGKKRKNVISEVEMKEIEAKMQEYIQEWKKKKRGCMDMINVITENMDKNRKDFMEEIGIDTDEANNTSCPV